ncbi:MAG: HD domain-containing response regulator [Magnetococcales bacterium]|nr:HD domain-containing response regulator [Magnetococcales bacterium]
MNDSTTEGASPSPGKRIIRKVRRDERAVKSTAHPLWQVLVVDDEPDIHAATSLALSNLTYEGRGIHLLHVHSGAEARRLLADGLGREIAVALIDVVMESDDAGLQLVRYIRQELGNLSVRLIIRTGQPGYAPELYIIEHYDIDDYKEKTDLTAQKLFTTMRLSLKSYNDLMMIEKNKKGLEYILRGAPELYKQASLQDFLFGVLTQIAGLFRAGEDSLITATPGKEGPDVLLVTQRGERDLTLPDFFCGTGRFQECAAVPEEVIECGREILRTGQPRIVAPGIYGFPLRIKDHPVGFVYLEGVPFLQSSDHRLLEVMINQITAALENHWLFMALERSQAELVQAHDHAIFMLAVVSELKDRETGNHINRIQYYSEALARQMGLDAGRIKAIGQASTLHDLGKLGIPDAIIRKPGKLTDEEFAVMQTHPQLAMDIFGDHPGFDLAREIAFAHHEKWDGSGYPRRLRGEEIPWPARLVAVVDVLDALTSERPYKKAWSMEAAIAEIQRCRGQHFDPSVVDALTQLYRLGVILQIKSRFLAG